MKKARKASFLPWLTIAAGVAGGALARWFYTSGINYRNLIVAGHPSAILLLLFSAVYFGVLLLSVRTLPRQTCLPHASVLQMIGCFVGAVGIAITGVQALSRGDFLSILTLILGVLAAGCLIFAGIRRLFGLSAHYLLYGVLTVFFVVLGLNRCRVWGSQAQVLLYFFCLLAQIFLMLTSYQFTACACGEKNLRSFVFCCHAAVFCCCTAFWADFDPLYLTAAIWLVSDGCFCHLQKKESKE